MIMESMDFESDDELSGGYNNRSLTPHHTNMKARGHLLDLSDMDIDPGSPHRDETTAKLSPSFERIINQDFSSVLSLNSLNDDSDNDTHHSDEKCTLPSTLTPCQKPESLPPLCHDLKKNWQPASGAVLGAVCFKNTKAGRTSPVEEGKYNHFPDVISSNSIRQRHNVHDVPSNAKKNQINCDSPAADIKKCVGNKSSAHFEDSVPSESGFKRRSSCFAFMSSLILLMLFLVTIYYFGMTYTIHDREKCKISRHFNKQVLKIELEANVFGQHIATKTVLDKIEEYFRRFDDNSLPQDVSAPASENVRMCKPLVLSFDGWTGVGKNYISKFISEAFQYFNIMNYVVPYNFPHKSFEDTYRLQIQQWILGNFTQCMVNIIVVDEVDKAFPTVIEGLTKSIKELTQPCSSTSPTIFLLLSNTHGNDIHRIFLKFLLDSPKRKREEISQDHFSSVFTSELNEWTNTLTSKQLIDAFVPFLPLEREHVIQCIKRDLVSKRFSTDVEKVNRVLQELSFSSFGDIHLSQTGCKRVADKVDLIMFEK